MFSSFPMVSICLSMQACVWCVSVSITLIYMCVYVCIKSLCEYMCIYASCMSPYMCACVYQLSFYSFKSKYFHCAFNSILSLLTGSFVLLNFHSTNFNKMLTILQVIFSVTNFLLSAL